MELQRLFQRESELFESHLQSYLAAMPREDIAGIRRLLESMEYSLLGGGKRFRPLLTLLTVEALGGDLRRGLPYAAAVEMVHTYSLIHDDLPLMDNDDMRRGRPTNHKVFGEAMALLAGDALLTEAFTSIADGYSEDSELAVELVRLLSRSIGWRGMVGGQAIDVLPLATGKQEWEVQYAHNLKTGALIRASIEGGAMIAGAEMQVQTFVAHFGKSLGLAFQVADDLQDYDPQEAESTSFVTVLGVEKTRHLLNDVTRQAYEALKSAGLSSSPLADLARFNLERTQEKSS